jgi:hypothetical protein
MQFPKANQTLTSRNVEEEILPDSETSAKHFTHAAQFDHIVCSLEQRAVKIPWLGGLFAVP